MRWTTRLLCTGPVLAGLLALGPGAGTAMAQDEGNLYNTGYDARMGERFFLRTCSRCHGQDAKGNDETAAPDLTGTMSRASTDAGIFEVIRGGIRNTAMLPINPDTPDREVWQIVAYLRSLRTDPLTVELAGTADAGRALYMGKGDCASCHMIDGQGGRQGPDLTRVGERRGPDELKMDLTDPHETVDPRWWTLRVTREDGSVVEGLRMAEDTFTLRVMDASNELWSFRKGDIQGYERSMDSTMPSYAETLTEDEVDDLVAYLFSLRKES